MDIYRSDDEQAEAIKKWWKENGRAVILGVVIGLSAVVGIRYWFQYQKTSAHNASVLYANIEKALANNDTKTVLQTGQTLLSEYGNTTYAVMASLAMAKAAVEEGNSGAAKDHLQWALNHADGGLQHTARIGLARLLLNDGKAQEAATLIADIKSPGFSSNYDELRADVALAQGNKSQARELYRLAFLGSSGLRRELLQMKLNSIGAEAAMVASEQE